MKKQLILSLLFLVFVSCNSDKKNANQNTDTAKSMIEADTIAIVSEDSDRDEIILEIERFKNAMTTKNRTEILSFFKFPLADTSVNFFEVDSLFDEKRKTSNGKITKEMFAGSFDRIYGMTDMLEFNNLFADMNLELLSSQNNIKKEKRPPNEDWYGKHTTLQEGEARLLVKISRNKKGNYEAKILGEKFAD